MGKERGRHCRPQQGKASLERLIIAVGIQIRKWGMADVVTHPPLHIPAAVKVREASIGYTIYFLNHFLISVPEDFVFT